MAVTTMMVVMVRMETKYLRERLLPKTKRTASVNQNERFILKKDVPGTVSPTSSCSEYALMEAFSEELRSNPSAPTPRPGYNKVVKQERDALCTEMNEVGMASV